MKRVILLLFVVLTGSSLLRAQDGEKFYFYNDVDKALEVNIETYKVPSHYLGEDIALKMYLVEQTYTIVEEATSVNPVEKTIVNKPSIFYSIKRLNKYYKRAIRKGEMTEEEVKTRLNNYLDICLSIYRQDTNLFEEALKNSKEKDEIVAVFSRVILE